VYLGLTLREVVALGSGRVEAHLVEGSGRVGDFEPPAESLEEAPQHGQVVLPGGVGHTALISEVNHIGFDLVCSYT
jgi:hypothetical protein